MKRHTGGCHLVARGLKADSSRTNSMKLTQSKACTTELASGLTLSSGMLSSSSLVMKPCGVGPMKEGLRLTRGWTRRSVVVGRRKGETHLAAAVQLPESLVEGENFLVGDWHSTQQRSAGQAALALAAPLFRIVIQSSLWC